MGSNEAICKGCYMSFAPIGKYCDDCESYFTEKRNRQEQTELEKQTNKTAAEKAIERGMFAFECVKEGE